MILLLQRGLNQNKPHTHPGQPENLFGSMIENVKTNLCFANGVVTAGILIRRVPYYVATSINIQSALRVGLRNREYVDADPTTFWSEVAERNHREQENLKLG